MGLTSFPLQVSKSAAVEKVGALPSPEVGQHLALSFINKHY